MWAPNSGNAKPQQACRPWRIQGWHRLARQPAASRRSPAVDATDGLRTARPHPGRCSRRLRRGPGSQEVVQAAERIAVVDLGGQFESFADTAAAILNLDLVISVDTAVAHCAGCGAGCSGLVAAALAPDYRWMLGRRDSPWYPTARLFRQDRWGDWAEVMTHVEAALREQLCWPDVPA